MAVSPSSSPVVWASGGGCHEGKHSGNNLTEGEESRKQPGQVSNLTQLFMLLVNSKLPPSQQEQHPGPRGRIVSE